MVAGIIAAQPDNGIGIAGIAPGVELVSVHACQPRTPRGLGARCWSSSLATAVDFSILSAARVINMSVAGAGERLLQRLIDQALSRDIVVVAARPTTHPDCVGMAPGACVPISDGRLQLCDAERVFLVERDTPGFRGCHDIQVFLELQVAAAACLSEGQIWDISDPLNAHEIAYLDTKPEHDNVGFHGAWSNYPYFPSGTIIVSDIERGLFILRLGSESLRFDYPLGVPEALRPSLRETFAFDVVEDRVTLDPDSVSLHFVAGGVEQVVPAQHQGGGSFTVELPPLTCFQTAEYWLSAADTEDQVYLDPFNAPISGGRRAKVYTDTTLLLTDDFLSDQGWTVQNQNVNRGAWARVPPQNANGYEPDEDSDGSGVCWVTGETPGDDLRGGPTIITSPPFDLRDYPEAYFEYDLWLQKAPPAIASVYVEVSADDGQTWSSVASHSSAQGWEGFSARVADAVARREIVGPVDDDVIGPHQVERVGRGNAGFVQINLHFGIDRLQLFLRRLQLGPAHVGREVQDLALEVALVDDVEVDQPDGAHARRRQVQTERRAEAARADQEHARRFQPLLPDLADLGDDEVPAVAQYLRVRELWQVVLGRDLHVRRQHRTRPSRCLGLRWPGDSLARHVRSPLVPAVSR